MTNFKIAIQLFKYIFNLLSHLRFHAFVAKKNDGLNTFNIHELIKMNDNFPDVNNCPVMHRISASIIIVNDVLIKFQTY
ncbi:hypothetical protein DERP_001556 [Dermatophagoides pteronyssinus]|uniref:Uncharacterized protein n=1 Tax=Dermatophagoides pteronyssinus TaxID=6956 RepID=A0ABQ8JBK8_DERPT|nr:hypothetical protein DERP_001556 [Dermatophagoides pteronyssinus]